MNKCPECEDENCARWRTELIKCGYENICIKEFHERLFGEKEECKECGLKYPKNGSSYGNFYGGGVGFNLKGCPKCFDNEMKKTFPVINMRKIKNIKHKIENDPSSTIEFTLIDRFRGNKE